MYRHIIICVQVFTGLIQAWIIKIRNDMRYVQLPSVEVPTQLRDEDVDFVVWCADIMVKIGAIWTGRKCFFRSYIIASVLRSWKIPVIINVGLCNLKVIDKTNSIIDMSIYSSSPFITGNMICRMNSPERI